MEPHPGSVDTLRTLERHMAPGWPIAPNDQWERFGFLGVFADYACNSLGGDLLEIGVGESSVYLSRVAAKYQRRLFHCDISPSKIINPMSVPGYLSAAEEITYFEDRDPTPSSFTRVVCFAGASDDLFKRVPIPDLALSFIDGDHLYDQARKDFWHCWERTLDHGFIVLHDTFPPNQDWTDENHCGEVYRLRRELEENSRMDCLTLTRGTAIGVGLTIVRKRPLIRELYQ